MYFVLSLLSLDIFFPYNRIFYPKTYIHYYTRSTFAPCFKGTLRSYEDLNRLYINFFSASKPKRDYTHSIYSIILPCRQGCNSYIHARCDSKPIFFQLADLPSLHCLLQPLMMLFAYLFLLTTARKGFQFLCLCTC